MLRSAAYYSSLFCLLRLTPDTASTAIQHPTMPGPAQASSTACTALLWLAQVYGHLQTCSCSSFRSATTRAQLACRTGRLRATHSRSLSTKLECWKVVLRVHWGARYCLQAPLGPQAPS